MSSVKEKCRVCDSETNYLFHARVMNKYDVAYYKCTHCDFVQTEQPYWLQESYESPVNFSDTGIIARNLDLAKPVTMILLTVFGKRKKYLDYAGGYGLFTRLMRDVGFDFYWQDPYTSNLVARGFEHKEVDSIKAITTFECFEHLVEPMHEIEKMLAITPNIIFSTRLIPNSIPKPSERWYYGLEHGQHVALYSKRSLLFIAKKYNLHLNSVKHFHMFSEKKVNPLLFKFLYYSGKLGLDKIIRLALRSKTELDNQQIPNAIVFKNNKV